MILDTRSANSWGGHAHNPQDGGGLVEGIEFGLTASPHTRLIFGSRDRPSASSTSEIWHRATTLSCALRERGLKPGDAIVSQLPNWEESVIVLLAALHGGFVYIPVIHIFGPSELAYIVNRSRAKALFVPNQWRKIDFIDRVSALVKSTTSLQHIVMVGSGYVPETCIPWQALLESATTSHPAHVAKADEICLMNFTSGTTANPKGVLHSHTTLGAEVRGFPVYVSPGDEPGPVLHMTPGGHITAAITMLRPFLCGETVIYMDQFDAELAMDLIREHRPSHLGGVPTQWLAMFELLEGCPGQSLRYGLTGAAGVPPSLIHRGQAMGICITKMYGLTEHPTISATTPADPLEKRATTDGRPLQGNRIRIVDDEGNDLPLGSPGEILSIGQELFVGYLDPSDNETAFTTDGWFRTGDIGVLDQEGYLAIVDRKKDIIIRGGENIASREVEEVLARHPAVAEAAVVAWPDAKLGECVGAFVQLKSGSSLSLEDIARHFAGAGIARQKTPEHLVIVDAFPRTPLGKIQKAVLRKKLSP